MKAIFHESLPVVVKIFFTIVKLACYLLINIIKKAEEFLLRFYVTTLFYSYFLFSNTLGYIYAFVSSFLCLGSFLASKTML